MCKQLQHLRRHAGLTRRQPSDEAIAWRKKRPGGEISTSHKANRARPAINVKREPLVEGGATATAKPFQRTKSGNSSVTAAARAGAKATG